jgi:hypothetical protein
MFSPFLVQDTKLGAPELVVMVGGPYS